MRVGQLLLGRAALVVCILQLSAATAQAGQPAFPGAEGWGAETIGGRGGSILEVTNLNDSGPGSLREAIEASGPRTVVFRVSGRIFLDSGLTVRNPFITLAGQTAPGEGIELVNRSSEKTPLNVFTHEVIVRHLRFRPGPGGDPDGVGVNGQEGGTKVIFDHVSISWSVDGLFDFYRSAELSTVQWSIITEPLDCSTHPKGCHGRSMIIGKYDTAFITVHHNLFAHAQGGRDPRVNSVGPVDYVNNVVHNFVFYGSWGASHASDDVSSAPMINYIGNYYKAGPLTGSGSYMVDVGGSADIYAEGNIVPDLIIEPGDEVFLTASPHPRGAMTTTSAQQAYDDVLNLAGDSRYVDCNGNWVPRYSSAKGRDSIDERVVMTVRNGTGPAPGLEKLDHPDEVGGYPPIASGTACVDSDHDGMPDGWETLNGFNPSDPSDGSADADGDGYTNVEEYLNPETAAVPPAGPPQPPVLLE
jgi:pectate lyase